jgi:hypothetical protein
VADTQRKPRRVPIRPDSETAAPAPAPAARNNQDGARRGRGSHGRDDDDGPQVKGLGDHVPAFLLRPARVG